MVRIIQYDKKIPILIVNLVETTWLTRYPRPTEIPYYQGSAFIGHELRKSLIEKEYEITAKLIGHRKFQRTMCSE